MEDLLRRDSVHGRFKGTIRVDEEHSSFVANGNEVKVIYADSPDTIDYTEYGIGNAIVIDNTSCFRYDKDVPLVVPEVNPHRVADYLPRNIIANPNCSTIQMLVALKPLHDAARITRINVATYQAVLRKLLLLMALILIYQFLDEIGLGQSLSTALN